MASLSNEFLWSVSRDRHFQQCPRLFYLRHYAHWGGWRLDADDFAKLCYRLGKVKSLDAWAGEIVHEVIRETLEKVRDGRPTSLEAMLSEATERLRAGWVQSQREQWRSDPKRAINLFEHYYHLDIPRERTDEIKRCVQECLENFWRSPDFDLIRRSDPGQWKCLEEFQSFELEGFTVALKIDFAMAHREWMYIYDWKTGRPREEDRRQLACYALFGRRVWGIPAHRMRVIPAYLRQNLFDEREVTPSDLVEIQDYILRACHRLLALLRDPAANRAVMEDFPMTPDRRTCRRCSFWEACYGNRHIEGRSRAGQER